jgi:predicted NBD/HSP70 family sugar kinase
MTALGIDVGGTLMRVATAPHDIRSAPVPADYRAFLDTAATIAPPGGFRSVAVGLPGATGTAVPRWIPALSYLDGRPLAADLAARLGAGRVTLANDAQLALLAEVREGAAAGVTDAVLVSVGTGIGGAIMLGGRIVRGAHGTAGSFGWLTAAGAVPTPDHGAFELAASGRALDRIATAAQHAAAAQSATAAQHATATRHAAPELIAAARSGDPVARAALAGWATALGTGIAAIASVLDPERVVLSGGLSDAFDAYADTVRAAIDRAGSPDGRRVALVPAALGSRAGVVGALHAATAGEEVWS